MAINYLNIPYELPDPFSFPLTRFLSIWKVEANEHYACVQSRGLHSPGMFITYDGQGHMYFLNDPQTIYVMGNKSYFILNANEPCRYECPQGSTWSFYFLHFNDLLLPKYLQLPITHVARISQIEFLTSLCERLIQNVIIGKMHNVFESNHLFHTLLTSLVVQAGNPRKTQDVDISPALYWMHQNIDKPFDIDQLMSVCHISRTLFFRMFKDMTGDTPSRYFYRLKLEAARLALANSDHTVKQIATTLQFYDEFHFTTLFKKTYGMSPSTYRSSL